MAMIQSTASWLLQPITMYTTFGTAHAPSWEHARVLLAWRACSRRPMGGPTSLSGNGRSGAGSSRSPVLKALANPDWEANKGRVKDMDTVISKMSECTKKYTTADLLKLFNENTTAPPKSMTSRMSSKTRSSLHLVKSVEEDTASRSPWPRLRYLYG